MFMLKNSQFYLTALSLTFQKRVDVSFQSAARALSASNVQVTHAQTLVCMGDHVTDANAWRRCFHVDGGDDGLHFYRSCNRSIVLF